MTQTHDKVAAAFGITHTPGLGNLMDRPSREQIGRILAGFEVVKQQVSVARPDVMIAFVNDHFDMFTRRGMPAFAVGAGATHWGPTPETEAWIQMQRGPVPGHPEVANAIYQGLMEQGIEPFLFDEAEFVHNILIPKKYLWPDLDIPVVPIYVNCFLPPLPSWRRVYELGAAVRRVVDGRGERVAFMASGGISHWPPITTNDMSADDPLVPRLEQLHLLGRDALRLDPALPMALLEREHQMVASGRPLINVEWDRMILEKLAAGDVAYFSSLTHEAARAEGGDGGLEMMLWVALMGAMRAEPADIVLYEAVEEWMGGVGLISYGRALRQG